RNNFRAQPRALAQPMHPFQQLASREKPGFVADVVPDSRRECFRICKSGDEVSLLARFQVMAHGVVLEDHRDPLAWPEECFSKTIVIIQQLAYLHYLKRFSCDSHFPIRSYIAAVASPEIAQEIAPKFLADRFATDESVQLIF